MHKIHLFKMTRLAQNIANNCQAKEAMLCNIITRASKQNL